MRPGQKNRMRGGRGNNGGGGGGRRGPNPLTRSYESNGPDVKVRGTPQHIAEKYVQLARDAHSSGDTVMAESYLQHAEHYYRIIAAAQNAQNAAYNQANGLPSTAPDDAMDDEDEFEVAGADRFTFRTPQSFQQNAQGGGYNNQGGYGQPGYQGGQSFGDVPGVGDQPSINADGQPIEGGQGGPMGGQGGGFQPRPPRGDRPFDQRRPFEQGGDRQGGDRQGGDRMGRDRQGRRFGRDRNFGDKPFGDRVNGEGRPAEGRSPDERPVESAPAIEEQAGLPSFITAPVRSGVEEEASAEGGEGGRLRRRRRRPRAEGAPEPVGGDEQS